MKTSVFKAYNVTLSRQILKRILSSLLIIWGVLSLTFLLIHLAPGDPLQLYIRPDIDPQTVENIRQQMGFNLPVWQQYVIWLSEICTGNFGESFTHHRPVLDIIVETLPNTLQLTVAVFILQFLLGIILGVISAFKQNTKADFLISTILLFLYAMPGFWVALIAIMIFSLKLGWLPSGQMSSLYLEGGMWTLIWDRLIHLILPVTVLSIPFIAYTTRFVREKLSIVLHQPYILAAKAFGIKSNIILYKYALRNALLPLVTLAGLYLPFLLGGAVITEYIFAWPGMGRMTIDAIFTHDFPLILASTIIAAFAVVAGNFFSDILYIWIDPRIKRDYIG